MVGAAVPVGETVGGTVAVGLAVGFVVGCIAGIQVALSSAGVFSQHSAVTQLSNDSS